MKTEMEVKKLITEAANEPKAPSELVEKALAMARAAERTKNAGLNRPAPKAQSGPVL